mgnify:CR=1 FL=1
MRDKLELSDEEWRKRLSDEEYSICRLKGTEPPFTGKYWNLHEKGKYLCAACGEELFGSDEKYESGSGWPSFVAPSAPDRVATEEDLSHGMRRTEIHCARCGSHLGHVFEDGPQPTGLRYCVNSAALKFEKSEE